MHNALRAAAVFTSAVTLGLAATGCGGSATSTTSTATHQRSAGAGTRAAIIHRCAINANGDPAAMGLCLAGHGVTLPSQGKLVTCAQAANTRAEVTACLTKAAQ
jgi:uncharacterized membrane protein